MYQPVAYLERFATRFLFTLPTVIITIIITIIIIIIYHHQNKKQK
jgi:hypothetical protein